MKNIRENDEYGNTSDCKNCGSDLSSCCGASLVNDMCMDCKEHSGLSHTCSECEEEISEEVCKEFGGACPSCTRLLKQ